MTDWTDKDSRELVEAGRNQMKDKEKRELVEAVGLCWHDYRRKGHSTFECSKCDNVESESAYVNSQLDPTDPADMEKIWETTKHEDQLGIIRRASNGWSNQHVYGFCIPAIQYLMTTEGRAQAMLEYFRSRGGEE